MSSLSLFRSTGTGAGSSNFGDLTGVIADDMEFNGFIAVAKSGVQLWVLIKSNPAIERAVNNIAIKPTLTGK